MMIMKPRNSYTTTLRELLENGFDIGLQDYPIYDEKYRNVLNDKIVNHFLFYEIGQETPSMFRWALNSTMNEIMPYYNQLYKSTTIEFNPLNNIDIEEVFTEIRKNENTADGTNESESTINADNTSTAKGNSLEITSNTPNSKLSLNDIKEQIYASETGQGQSDSTSTSKDTNTGKSKNRNNVKSTNKDENTYIKKTIGSSAGLPFSKAIDMWRKTFINIDQQIIKELHKQGVFMQVF